MKKIILILLLSVNFLFANVGKITGVKGEASVKRASQILVATVGFSLEKNDEISTKDKSKVLVLFQDGTSVTIGKSSIMKINEYMQDATTPQNNKANIGFGQGVFRTITGKIGKANPNGFKLETKSASLGIRGSDGITIVNENGDVKHTTNSGGFYIVNKATGKSFDIPKGMTAKFEVKSGQTNVNLTTKADIDEVGDVEKTDDLKQEVAEETKEETKEEKKEEDKDVTKEENKQEQKATTDEKLEEQQPAIQKQPKDESSIVTEQPKIQEEMKIDTGVEDILEVDMTPPNAPTLLNPIINQIPLEQVLEKIDIAKDTVDTVEDTINKEPSINEEEKPIDDGGSEELPIDEEEKPIDDGESGLPIDEEPNDDETSEPPLVEEEKPVEEEIPISQPTDNIAPKITNISVLTPSGNLETLMIDLATVTKEIVGSDTYNNTNILEYGYILENSQKIATYIKGILTPSAVIESYISNNQTGSYSGNIASFVNGIATNGTINLNMNFGTKNFTGAINVGSDWKANINSGTISSYGFNSTNISSASNSTVQNITGEIAGKYYGINASSVGGTLKLNSGSSSVNGVFGGAKQ